MSGRFSRPRRTKMYDCNYNMSERYYKPMVDHLDRKYSTAPSLDREIRDIPRHFSPLADGRRRDVEKSPEIETRRRPLSAMLEEFDGVAEGRAASRFESRASRAAQQEEDDEVAASMKRLQASRAARAALEEEISEISNLRSQRKPIGHDYSDKLLDTVGLKSGDIIEKTRFALEEEPFFKRRVFKLTAEDDEEDNSTLTKWTAVKDRQSRRHNEDLVEEDGGPSALMRARQSRNRLADLDAEMEMVADRTAAREKRNNHLRALVQENHENSEALASNLRIKKTTIRSEKKTVTF